jgi:hypothetical protein
MSDVGELDSDSSFFANVLAPGSSLNPTFLVIVHTAFFALFGVLTALAYLTSGNKHVLALIMIELALWATVYWSVDPHCASAGLNHASAFLQVRQ